MRTVFADTWYWIATFSSRDQWNEEGRRACELVEDAALITTYDVLTEFLNAMARAGPNARRQSVIAVRAILGDPGVRVLPQSRDSFLRGVERYENRPDKGHSLVDCISMNAMDRAGIREVLTNDRHFEQEG